WRPGHIALLIFQAVWLNVIVPGHTRGSVALPGSAPYACADSPIAHRCCHAPAPKDDPPSPGNRGKCAICFFAARLSTPPAIDATLAALGLSPVAPLPAPAVPHCAAPRCLHFS